jgi:glutaredoxin
MKMLLLPIVAAGLVAFAFAGAPPTDAEPGSEAAIAAGLAADSAPAAMRQTYYQYVEHGKVVFVSRLEDVPEKLRARAGRVVMDEPPASAARTSRARATAASVRVVAEQTDVIIYTTKSCGYCRRAVKHLQQRGVSFVNKDIEADASAEIEYREKGNGRRGVPLIDIGGEIIRGYDKRALDAALDRHLG